MDFQEIPKQINKVKKCYFKRRIEKISLHKPNVKASSLGADLTVETYPKRFMILHFNICKVDFFNNLKVGHSLQT